MALPGLFVIRCCWSAALTDRRGHMFGPRAFAVMVDHGRLFWDILLGTEEIGVEAKPGGCACTIA